MNTHITIVIRQAPHGYQVSLSPEHDHRHFDHWCADADHARSCANGVHIGTGWPIDDRTAGRVVVEQLNHAQWHVQFPSGRASGAINYVEALAYAMIVAAIDGWAVETVSLHRDRLLMMRPSPMVKGGEA